MKSIIATLLLFVAVSATAQFELHVPTYCVNEVNIARTIVTKRNDGMTEKSITDEIDAIATSNHMPEATASYAKEVARLLFGLSPDDSKSYEIFYNAIIDRCVLEYGEKRTKLNV